MNRNTTLVLVAVFGALLLYVLLVQRPREQAAAEATATPGPGGPVWTISSEQVAGVRLVDHAQNREVAFSKDGQGIWKVTEPEAREADQQTASSTASQVTTLHASTILTNVADLAAFGVLSPTYTLEVSLTDGAKRTAAIGDKAPTGTGYYVLPDGQNNVMVVSTGSIDSLIALLDQPPYYVPTETPLPTIDLSASPAATSTLIPTARPTATPGATGSSAPSATP